MDSNDDLEYCIRFSGMEVFPSDIDGEDGNLFKTSLFFYYLILTILQITNFNLIFDKFII